MMRTKGDLCGFAVRDEQTYGQISTTASIFGGRLRTLETPPSLEVGTDAGQCGTRKDGPSYIIRRGYGYKAVFTYPSGSDAWTGWFSRALGALTGIQRELDTHSAAFHVAPDEDLCAVGAMVTSLVLSAGAIGEAVEWTVESTCRYLAVGQDGTFTIPGSTVDTMDFPAVPSGAPLTYQAYPTWAKASGSPEEVKAKSWTLTVANTLTEEPGLVEGIPLSAGLAITPGATSITLEVTVTSAGPDWDEAQAEWPTGMTWRVPLGGKTLVLKGCRFDVRSPSRSAEAGYDETIAVIAQDMAVE